ncbi:MAG: DEAD/DEAH box helicase, partial [Candidatus Competibacteraceae bacterium]|nr:DEAD/DEAH box helicase [Candidatus Competibacteraceae bacterium]
MLPSLIAREISEGLKQYLITGFETPTPFFRGAFTALAEQPGGLFKGPYLSLGYPFQPSGTGRDFFAGFETEHPPFVHQEQAWRRLSADREARSALIATGTGSGKTECFLYPLLDYCLREHEAGRPQGIKAIVIYPMNALANDQARRFAAAIHANANLRGRLRAGLFVGTGDKTPNKSMTADNIISCRDALREAPPDILLTNYKMLDYMLIRPRDRALWRFNQPATLRYLVVDELHTFDGAQGTDLACLLRRLRARLQTPVEHIIAVGTSATLGAESEKGPLAHYASQVFQSPFDEQSIIGESRQSREQFLGSEAI